MDDKIEFKEFKNSEVSRLIAFTEQFPWRPIWPRDLMHRFMSELVSSPIMIMDVYCGERAAVAVLIDKIKNKGNNATLEILAVNPRNMSAKLFEAILERPIELRPTSASGIELTVHDSYTLLDKVAKQLGFEPYYETFEMLVTDLKDRDLSSQEVFDLSSEEDDQELYRVLLISFQNNVDTSIPDFETWRANRRRYKDSVTYLAKQNGQILGFLNLVMSTGKAPEIRTVGVLPAARGKGLGKKLILSALKELSVRGHQECVLTVAIQNRNALVLYRNLGFRETDHFNVYRRSVSKYPSF